MKEIEFSLGSDIKKDNVTFSLHSFGRDSILFISGGEVHIGSVGCSDKQLNNTCYFNLNIHKEGKLVQRVLKELKNNVRGELLVVAGIHYENITKQQIEKILLHVDKLTQQLKEHLKN